MARTIIIEKVYSENGIYYYIVSSKSLNHPDFFLGIDSKANKLLFYLNRNFEKPIASIDLTKDKEKPIPEIEGISSSAFKIAIARAIRAMRKNEFPENMSMYT